ncbi:hypothetical protein V3390_00740 [Luteimonas sp. FXH3W]|uniref:Uncharacterized protein n=1 Tax=Aquilutibacter rugosus TaxID=3115820 RepID=A0ABU7UWC2_9GAMM
MKYRIELKEITERDIGPSCLFVPDHDAFEMHVSAFFEDISELDGVADAQREGLTALAFESTLTLAELRDQIKVFVIRDWNYLRIHSFVKQ